ncbi:MAG: hypothetical protein V4685_01335 [Bacteroidota bacterium]
MKHILFSTLLFISNYCFSQDTSDTVLYNKEFKWTLIIPEHFVQMKSDSVKAMHDRGMKAIEKSYKEKVEDNTTGIFMFKNNRFNYFESCSQPFDTSVDGDYTASIRLVASVVYNTFKSQIENIEINSSSAIEKICGLEFHRINLTMHYPKGLVFYAVMYSRLFGKKELALNIYYTDEIKGFQMLRAWRQSKFGN